MTINVKTATKFDNDKPYAYTVLSGFSGALNEVIKVGTDGAKVHGKGNWKGLDVDRLKEAFCRHIMDYLQGNKIDKDSGSPAMAHVAWNALAILQLELEKKNENCSSDKNNNQQ